MTSAAYRERYMSNDHDRSHRSHRPESGSGNRRRDAGSDRLGGPTQERNNAMDYLLKTDNLEFEVAKVAVPKTDLNGVQKIDRDTQWPIYTVVLLVLDVVRETAEDLTVSVPSPTMPNLRWREPVSVVDLEMIPWASTGGRDGALRSGVAFRAKEIRPAA